ncbi:MAG: 50S ribosomal protein L13, partial [Anaerolineales bacterium]
MQKTYVPKKDEITHEWYLVDANDQLLGRFATKVAAILLGKHKPNYTPGVDTGDYVVVVNAERIRVTGNKLDSKIYYHYSGYPSGMKE